MCAGCCGFLCTMPNMSCVSVSMSKRMSQMYSFLSFRYFSFCLFSSPMSISKRPSAMGSRRPA